MGHGEEAAPIYLGRTSPGKRPGGRIPQVEVQRAYRARLAAAVVRVVDAISVRGSIRISGVAGARPGQITVCPPSFLSPTPEILMLPLPAGWGQR
jgi:hypothetical protein